MVLIPARLRAASPRPSGELATKQDPIQPLTTEEKRIAAAQQGDLAAFEELVREYQGCVVTTAYHLLGNEADADDVSQEVWIRVYRSLERFQFRSRFSTYLYRITVNQALTALKRRGRRLGNRRQDLRIDEMEGEFTLPDDAPDARTILEGKEAVAQFREALETLPEKQRLAVILVLFEGLSHGEAGEVMKVAEKTVSWHLFQARKSLLQKMKGRL
jgi:RNA polymerase sigma-70 factor, ECF subfamily